MPKVVDVDQRRAQLADAASRLIARSGIEAATMREVAAEAGLTTGALTHYFTDKHELLLTTFQASLAGRRSLRPPLFTADPLDRLLASLEGALPLDDDRRRHWMVTIACCSQAVADPELERAQRDAYTEFTGYVAELVVECRLARRAEAEHLAAMLIGAADGIAVQALFDEQRWPAARQSAVLASMLAAMGVQRPR